MYFIEPKVEIIDQKPGKQGIFEQIEKGARICYKSENKTEFNEEGESLTARKFVDNILNVKKHTSVAEHGTVYLKFPIDDKNVEKYCNNKYSKVVSDPDYLYVTTNYRVLLENNWLDDLKAPYLCEVPEDKHIRRITVKFWTQVAIAREAHRHRVHSPSEESTRYCNYSKDKFGNEISICEPEFLKNEGSYYKIASYDNTKNKEAWLLNYCRTISSDYNNPWFDKVDYWLFANIACEYSYLGMIKLGAKPEEARTILPLDTKTEFYHTAFEDDWKTFLDMRTANVAHDDIKVLAHDLKKQFIERGYKEFE
ncbi:MAG: FAD-dependent thymidylate synthase [Erysipelotrichales bacterium]|nr:FAD-dependent thymidylate synthase [Erysipelotrichales bacterium]